jgi:ABC-type phosphate transport system substrate-binding protein
VRDIYAGRYRRWGEVVPGRTEIADLPIVLVSRGDESGTRQIFQDRVLKGWERAPSTSLDCRPPTRPDGTVTRCELGSTRAVLDKVEEQPGAIGYSEVGLAKERGGKVTAVPLDGDWPDEERIDLGAGPYPYKDVEYAYTYGPAPADSLAASFLAYLDESTSQKVIRGKGHLPCLREPRQCR